MSTSRAAGRAAPIGPPPTLPLSLAARVAWTSIRVRLSRSLVTLSSVILAVAFLLVVAGEDLAQRAVHRAHVADSLPLRRTQALRDLLARPRPAPTLLALLADRQETTRAWAAGLGHAVPRVDPGQAALALDLIRWIARLTPTQSYLVLRNRQPAEWLLSLDQRGALDAFLAASGGFTGVRLAYDRERLAGLAAAVPDLREALAALAVAETVRLAQVAVAGGPDAVLERLRAGADPAALTALGAPVDQVLPEVWPGDPAAQGAIRAQIALDQARLRAAALLAELNGQDPALLQPGAIADWQALESALALQASLPGETPAKRLAPAAGPLAADLLGSAGSAEGQARLLAALNAALASPGLHHPDAWPSAALPDQARRLLARPRLTAREQTHLNRLLLESAFPGIIRPLGPVKPFTLRQLAAGADGGTARVAAAQARLAEAIAPVGTRQLAAELERRERLAAVDQAFAAIAYDPDDPGTRRLWLVLLSLLVCVVGIVNTMLMAVTERFREIATMKCLGARDGFIMQSFLIECGAVGLVGAALGAAGGVLIVVLQAASRFGGSWWAACPTGDLALAALAALLGGMLLAVLGALLPALKAARMQPIAAMRVDL